MHVRDLGRRSADDITIFERAADDGIGQLREALEDGEIAVFEPSRMRVRRLPIVPRRAPDA